MENSEVRVTSTSCPNRGMGVAICTPCIDQLLIGVVLKRRQSSTKATMNGYLLTRFVDAGGLSSSVLQGPSGRHSRVRSTQGAISASSGLHQAGGHTHGG